MTRPSFAKERAAQSAKFEELLDTLIGIASAAAVDKRFGAADRKQLATVIKKAFVAYDAAKYWNVEFAPLKKHKHPERLPLAKAKKKLLEVIEILDFEPNWPTIFSALGDDAAARHEALLRDLEIISRAPASPPKRKSVGTPPKSKDLQALVAPLMKHWIKMTKKPFRKSWDKDEMESAKQTARARTADRNAPEVVVWVPRNRKGGAYFVYEAVRAIDSERLSELPYVTEQIASFRK